MGVVEAVIRVAGEGDATAIAAIYAPYVQKTAISFEIEPPAAETMAQRIATTLETHPWLVADCGGEVIGYAYAGKHRERAAYRWTVDTTVYVDAAVHRRGTGHALYRVLLDMLRQQGFRSAFAEIVLPIPVVFASTNPQGSNRLVSTRILASNSDPSMTSAIGAWVWLIRTRSRASLSRSPHSEERRVLRFARDQFGA
jgi:L-amino acid N-acyltransferase YncA